VYVYDDKGCDCAGENLPVAAYLTQAPEELHAVKKCAGGCCGDQGVLLKKYEQALGQ
jgi:pyruvate formate lyase activating enzyme